MGGYPDWYSASNIPNYGEHEWLDASMAQVVTWLFQFVFQNVFHDENNILHELCVHVGHHHLKDTITAHLTRKAPTWYATSVFALKVAGLCNISCIIWYIKFVFNAPCSKILYSLCMLARQMWVICEWGYLTSASYFRFFASRTPSPCDYDCADFCNPTYKPCASYYVFS